MRSVSTRPAAVNAPAFMFNSGRFGQPFTWQFADTLADAKALKAELGGCGAILSVSTVRNLIAEKVRYGAALDPYTISQIEALQALDAETVIPEDEDIAIEEASASLSVSFAPAAFRVPVAEALPLPVPARRMPRRVVGEECRVVGSPRLGKVVAEIGGGRFWVNVWSNDAKPVLACLRLRIFDDFTVIERRMQYATHGQRVKAIRARAIENGTDD